MSTFSASELLNFAIFIHTTEVKRLSPDGRNNKKVSTLSEFVFVAVTVKKTGMNTGCLCSMTSE